MPTQRAFKIFRCKIKIKLNTDAKFDQTVDNLLNLTPSVWQAIMRGAITASLLQAYLIRFKGATRNVSQQIYTSSSSKPEKYHPPQGVIDITKDIQSYIKILSDPNSTTADKAQARKDITAARKARLKVRQSKNNKKYRRANPASVTYQPGSEGYQLILQALQKIYRPLSTIKLISRKPMKFVFGDLNAIEAVRTPSFTEYYLGLHTTSLHDRLWHQFEFGTGTMKKGPTIVGPTHLVNGAWRYQGVKIEGSNPANVFRDASGLPYDKDAQRFDIFLQQHLMRALRGA